MEVIKQFYEKQANTIIKNLKKRQMDGYYCSSAAEATELALSLTPPMSTVSFGGSMTLNDIGLLDALKEGDYNLLDRSSASSRDEIMAIYHKALSADTYFMSSNAISLDGQLVNIDGNGNRVAALIFGPSQVIVIVGMNKVESSLDKAIGRAQNTASPANAIRLQRKTPCTSNGYCGDCQSEDCICANTVITRRSSIKSRVKVILVGEVLGY